MPTKSLDDDPLLYLRNLFERPDEEGQEDLFLCKECKSLKFDEFISDTTGSSFNMQIYQAPSCRLCFLFSRLVKFRFLPFLDPYRPLLNLERPSSSSYVSSNHPSSDFIRCRKIINAGTDYESILRLPVSRDYFGIQNTVKKDYQGLIGLAAEHGSYAAQYIARRVTHWDRDEPNAVKTIKDWLNTCDTNHTLCHRGISGQTNESEPLLPTRLLEVVSVTGAPEPSILRLVDSDRQHGAYLALSHRWGGGSACQTTVTNLKRFQEQGIDYAELPLTLKDAAKLTKSLGLRFLWIDSLCIIQDSPEDWARESEKMGSVYENAYCTIAATKAIDTESGFLLQDLGYSRATLPYCVQMPCDPDKPQQGSFYFTPPHQSDFFHGVERAQLNSRGWVVQERLLSRRTIHFAGTQMYWECRQSVLAEDGLQHRPNVEGLAGIARSLSDLNDVKVRKTSDSHAFNQNFNRIWHRIIATYSACEFTRLTDRLPALLGLAERLKSSSGLAYHYGNWVSVQSKHFPWCLAWWACHPGKRMTSPHVRAPSWSWSALEGEVFFEQQDGQPLVGLLAVDVSERLGLPAYASLRVNGRLCAVSVDQPSKADIQKPVQTSTQCSQDVAVRPRERVSEIFLVSSGSEDGDEGDCVGHITFDRIEATPTSFNCLLLYMDQVDCPVVLALERNTASSQGVPEYGRVGIGSLKRQIGETVFGEEAELALI